MSAIAKWMVVLFESILCTHLLSG